MTIAVNINGTLASIVLSGGIDYSTQEDFRNANKQALSAQGVTEIHVDFIKATFLDSAGIRALLILQKDAEAMGKAVYLLNCNEYMLDIFEIGGFNKVFKFQ